MDQLNDYLLNTYPSTYSSANEGQSFLVVGKKLDSKPAVSLYTISVKQSELSIDFVKELLIGSSFYILAYRISKQMGIPLITIAFPADCNEESRASFIMSTDGYKNPRIVNSSQLEKELLGRLDLQITPDPAKAVNKRTADFFHDWSRKHLPSGDNGVIKCDIDGLFHDEENRKANILIEIKRSSIPPIPKWKPYKNDFSGLNFLKNIASALNSRFWIMHHEGNNLASDSEISIFDVDLGCTIDDTHNPKYVKVYNPIQLKGLNEIL